MTLHIDNQTSASLFFDILHATQDTKQNFI